MLTNKLSTERATQRLAAFLCPEAHIVSVRRHTLLNYPRIKRKTIYAESEGTSEPSASDAARAAIQERIRKASEYSRKSKEMPTETASRPGPSYAVENADASDARLAQYGAEVARGQQEALEAAMKSLEAEPSGNDPPPLDGDGERLLREQRVVRMGASASNRVSPTLHAKLKSFVETAQPDNFATDTFSRSRSEDSPDAAGGEAGPLGGATAEDVERQASAVSGSDSRAASYLQQASQTQASEAAGMRAEEFTAFKEEQVKARGVEFVTKDGTYNPLEPGGSRDPNYRPKVATWGMFPRPNDISKTYGGGRTYRPGEALESSEAAKERKDRVSAAMRDYRQRHGLFVDPDEEARCTAVFSAGMQMMEAGQLAAAIGQFDDVLKAVSPRSRIGGEAQLQRAICLDSAGKNDEAYKIYMTLERHPQAIVQKQAKRMLFGFRAADNLKASTMSYAVGAKGNQDWEKYFTKLSGQWSSGYVKPSEEEEDQTLYLALAAAVVLLPLLLVSLAVFGKA